MAKPTDAELDEIKGHLLLFKDDSSTKIDLVVHDSSTDTQFAAIAAKPEFEDLPFAVIQYDDLGAAKCFLNRPDDSWDIGSGGKVSIATTALSLLVDIRSMANAGLVDSGTTAARLNDLLHFVWSRHDDSKIKKLALGAHFPIPALMFEVTSTDVLIRGLSSVNFTALANRPTLKPDGRITPQALASKTFGDRINLAMAFSDNAAARSCQGTVGIAFINAVCEKLGLFDPVQKRGLRIVGDYAPNHPDLPPNLRQPQPIGPRALGRLSPDKRLSDIPYAATARVLATLMSAIMTDNLFNDPPTCQLFRDLLLVRDVGDGSWALNAIVASLPANAGAVVQFSKIGAWMSNAEFTHIRIGNKQFSLIILGLLDKNGVGWNVRAQRLALEVHQKIGP